MRRVNVGLRRTFDVGLASINYLNIYTDGQASFVASKLAAWLALLVIAEPRLENTAQGTRTHTYKTQVLDTSLLDAARTSSGHPKAQLRHTTATHACRRRKYKARTRKGQAFGPSVGIRESGRKRRRCKKGLTTYYKQGRVKESESLARSKSCSKCGSEDYESQRYDAAATWTVAFSSASAVPGPKESARLSGPQLSGA
ncbi:hypothetical protein CFAM422_004041 [Trichoderma lentiforme]|uniref:Uncharacterized protein n=1 Tax=Trichoderma lentiforme TaxID=1567552 RepID=A0A9P5CFN6_9HYPO|nr:hypothetical protein CFAM422_004041 [Trichoderma lentiforme]